MHGLPLDPGERVAWSGRPSRWRYAMESLPQPQLRLGALFFFGGIFFSLSFSGVESAAEERWPVFVPLFASAGGVAMMSVFPLRYRQAGRLVYYITNQRAIIYDHLARTIRNSFRFDVFPTPVIVNYSGGCDIVFHADMPNRYEETELEHTASVVRHGLIAVEQENGLPEWLAGHIESCRTSR